MIRAYITAAFTALLSFAALLLYFKGHKDADDDSQIEDFERAEEIRRRVSVDRDKRVRELDDAGYRD